jgi:8-oxo-dGTP pyrophosphatase MutT (NUDIX family)
MNRFLVYPLLFFAFSSCHSYKTHAPRLSEFIFHGASVLVTTYNNGKQYAVLAREGVGNDKGYWDDFGGGRKKGEKHPLETAARETHEEMNADKTLGWSLSDMRRYIDLAAGNTRSILAVKKCGYGSNLVTFITHFKYKDVEQFFKNFYAARTASHDFSNREKDLIALVAYDDFKRAVSGGCKSVFGQIVDPRTGNLRQYKESITLRPILIDKLQSFFDNKPYEQGIDSRIRFY